MGNVVLKKLRGRTLLLGMALVFICLTMAGGSLSMAADGSPSGKTTAIASPERPAAINSEVQGYDESLTFTVKTPSWQMTRDNRGFDKVDVAGFDTAGAAGEPALPMRSINIALPPTVDMGSVSVHVTRDDEEELTGTYIIAPMPPPVTWSRGKKIISWGKDPSRIVDGKDMVVYGSSAFFPVSPARLDTYSQMRKWRFVRLMYMPFRYNPVTGKMTAAKEVEVKVSYNRLPVPQSQVETELRDTVMDQQAEQMFENYEKARQWYIPSGSDRGINADASYVIITTEAIKNGSAKLSSFVTHKQAKGYSVETITETTYGSLTGQAPNGTAEKIRQWLKTNYSSKNIQNVLLIGNPDPTNGDVPMKMCWPRRSESSDQEAPTDYFYADLTGNWDLNGNGYYGEYNGDRGAGGVDFTPEVYVGRIPVYASESGWSSTLDGILQKIMDYENSTDTAWRKAAILPMSYSDSTTDGAPFGEKMKSDYLTGAGYSTYTLYQHKTTGCTSSYSSNENLINNAVRSRWQNNKYGIVTWWGHGSATETGVGYGSGACDDGLIFASADNSYLNDSYPSFTYQCSCNNGYPENTDNMGYALLKRGAVTTISASRVSWYAIGDWSPNTSLGDNATIGYYYMKDIVGKVRAGKSLYDEKSRMSAGWGGDSWMNFMDFNLYGDPAISIDGAVRAAAAPTPWGNGNVGAVFADYGTGNGIWSNNGTNWSKLSDWQPAQMINYSTYGMVVNINQYGTGNGVYLNDGSSWRRISDWISSDLLAYGSAYLAGSFADHGSSSGIYRYDGSGWSRITDWLPALMTSVGPYGTSDNQLYASFTSYSSGNGIWKNNDGASWSRITDWTPGKMSAWGNRFVGIFTNYGSSGNGVWVYENSGWQRITDWTPSKVVSWKDDTLLAGIFGGHGSESGLYSYNGSAWTRLTDWVPSDMAKLGTEELIAVFKDYGSGNGVWKYSATSSSWTRISDWVPDAVSSGTDFIMGTFTKYDSSGNGVWKYRSGAWTKMTDWIPKEPQP